MKSSAKESGDRIRVNGEWRPFEPATVADLCRALGVETKRPGIAVAVNDEVVPRSRWEERRLRPGDAVEIIGATQGG